MELETSMATRTRIKHNGDMGEAEVLKDFLKMGAAVNSLTGVDYGLDLHVQVPLEPQEFGKLQPSWPLSGRVAHIQVKNMTSGQNPAVAPDRVRGWIAGSKVGIPTFVVVLKGDSRYFLSPRDLRTVLAGWEKEHATALAEDAENERARSAGELPDGAEIDQKAPKTVTLTGEGQQPFDPKSFPWLLHLWTRYPGLMMLTDVQDWPGVNVEKLTREGHQLIGDVVLAWMRSHHPDAPLDRATESSDMSAGQHLMTVTNALPGALSIALSGYRSMYPVLADGSSTPESMALDSFDMLGEAVKTCGYRWPKAPLMTSYALSAEPTQSMHEACQLLRDAMNFHYKCRVEWGGHSEVTAVVSGGQIETEFNSPPDGGDREGVTV